MSNSDTKLLRQVLLWLVTILLPQASLFTIWFYGTLAGDTSLLGGVRALREFASDANGIRSTVWSLGLCGLVASAGAVWLSFQPSSFLVRQVWLALVSLASAMVLIRACVSGDSLTLPGTLVGLLVLLGLLCANIRLISSSILPAVQKPTRTSVLCYAATAGVALALYSPALLSLDAPTYDEAFSLVQYASLGPMVSLVRYDFPNNHIAYNVVVSTLLPNGTASLLVARLVSFAWFLGLLASAGSVAHVLGGRRAQLTTVACLLLHGSLFTQAYTGRGYTMAMCLGTLGWLFLLRAPSSDGPYARLFFLAAAATVPSWAVLFGIGMLSEWTGSKTWSVLGSWLSHAVIAIIWYLPALVFLTAVWDQSWLGTQSSIPINVSNTLQRSIGHLVGWRTEDVITHWLFFIPLAVCLVVGAGTARLVGRRFAILSLFGVCTLMVACIVHDSNAVLRQFAIFIPAYAVLVGVGCARILQPLPATWRAMLTAAVSVGLIVLPLTIGAVELGSKAPSESSRQIALFLSERAERRDLVHASSPDSGRIVYLMGTDQSFHGLDLILARLGWREALGNIWLVVRPARSTLDEQLARLRAFSSPNDFFLPAVLELDTESLQLYRLTRKSLAAP